MPSPELIAERRLRVLLLLSGIFLGCLAMLNLLGLTRFLVLGSYEAGGWSWGSPASAMGLTFAVAVGVLPYPLTFLCTDLISEFYGRRRANFIVLLGLLLNLLIIAVLELGSVLPGFAPNTGPGSFPPMPAWDGQTQVYRETGWTFFQLRSLALGAVAASMVAYLLAQFVDVQLYHFWKRRTKGKALWLRNNASTVVSQFIDTFAVITITHFYAHNLPIRDDSAVWPQLWTFIATGYAFKVVMALLDTPLIYAASWWLKRYLHLDPTQEHHPAIVTHPYPDPAPDPHPYPDHDPHHDTSSSRGDSE